MASGYIGTGAADRDPAIGNDTVTSSKISDDAVTAAKINILDDALAATDAHIMVADGTDFGNVAISGDVTMTNAGVVTIANTSVENAMMAANSVDSDQYVDGSIDTDHIGDNQVTLAKIADGTQGDILYYGASGAPALLGVGTTGQLLKTQGSSANPVWVDAPPGLFTSYAIIADQKTQGTHGGTFTLGAWRTRDLNTEIADPDGIVSIATNQFTLAAGTYLIKWTAPSLYVQYNQTRLYNVTDAAVAGLGMCLCAYNSGDTAVGSVRTTIAGSKAFTIEHRCSSTYASRGFGGACSFGTEQYTTVEIYKEA